MLTVTKKDQPSTQENIRNAANEAGHKVREFVDTATHEVRDAAAATEKQIREHPLRSSAIAAGVGFLLGALFGRR